VLNTFLNNKPLYYERIDYARMPRVYEKVKFKLPQLKIIHIIGTNGKGTTGRFLASSLYSLGFKVGHYTSPHILEFNERIWLNGNSVGDDILDNAHKELQNILTKEDSNSLSYFEYTTLLAMLIYKECDYVVLEAGLGGEYDATAVFPKVLTLVTPIDFDHEAFLGDSLTAIATTKLNAIQKNAIISYQKYDEVYDIARKKDANIYQVDDLLEKADLEKIKIITDNLSLVNYLQDNLKLSIVALKFLNIQYGSSDFKDARLFGRLSRLDENIYVDVGHNILAASAISDALNGEKYVLIYNTYKDKNYKEILQILTPIIKRVEIIDVDDIRIESIELLQSTMDKLNLENTKFYKIDKNTKYLVFGSFSVVENFLLKGYNE